MTARRLGEALDAARTAVRAAVEALQSRATSAAGAEDRTRASVPAVLGNAVLYRNGVPIASLESSEVVVRVALDPGARVDADLTYHAPPRRPAPLPQTSLPLPL